MRLVPSEDAVPAPLRRSSSRQQEGARTDLSLAHILGLLVQLELRGIARLVGCGGRLVLSAKLERQLLPAVCNDHGALLKVKTRLLLQELCAAKAPCAASGAGAGQSQ